MRIVSRYVTFEFLKILLLISTALTAVYMIVDIFENLSDFTKTHADLYPIAKYFLLRLPQAIYYIAPLSLLFSSFVNLGLFAKYNEVTAIRSGGLSVLNVVSPILVIAFVISISVFILNDSVVPTMNRRAEDIKRNIEKRPREMFFKEDSLWLKSDSHTLYNVRFADPDKKVLWRINVYYLSPDFQIKEIIAADKAVPENGQWFLESGIRRVFNVNNRVMKAYSFDRLQIAFPFELKDFRHAIVQTSETRFSVLKNYIEKISREGYEVTRLSVDLYTKTSFPITGFILTIIGMSLALYIKRFGGIASGIGLCVLVSILYWVCFSLSLYMGYTGYLSPVISAWLTNILFMGIGGYMFYRAMQI